MRNAGKENCMLPAQRALLAYMQLWSEEAWAAGWLNGLEYTLWDWVLRLRSNTEATSEFERANIPDTEHCRGSRNRWEDGGIGMRRRKYRSFCRMTSGQRCTRTGQKTTVHNY
jgi:hypothetical protein